MMLLCWSTLLEVDLLDNPSQQDPGVGLVRRVTHLECSACALVFVCFVCSRHSFKPDPTLSDFKMPPRHCNCIGILVPACRSMVLHLQSGQAWLLDLLFSGAESVSYILASQTSP